MTERLKEAKMPSGHEIERGRRKRMRERERGIEEMMTGCVACRVKNGRQ